VLNIIHKFKEVFMDKQILRIKRVVLRTGLSRSTIYALIAKGEFPKQVKLTGARSVGWLETAVNEWIVSRIQS